MKRTFAYLIIVAPPLVVIALLLAWVANRPATYSPDAETLRSESYLAVATPVGTQPVLPTLPPLPPVPSAAPSAIVSVTSIAVQPTAAPTSSSQSQVNSVQLLHSETFGSWSYVAKRVGNGPPSADVRIDTNSITSLQSFITANRQYAEELAKSGGKAIIRIVFRQPMDIETYRAWAKRSGITYFDMVCLPGTDMFGGPVGTLCLFPRSSDPLPATTLTQAKKDLHAVQEVYFLKGEIAANLLPTLVMDTQVLVVDLTDNIVRRDLTTADVPDATGVVVSNNMQIPKVIELLGH